MKVGKRLEDTNEKMSNGRGLSYDNIAGIWGNPTLGREIGVGGHKINGQFQRKCGVGNVGRP